MPWIRFTPPMTEQPTQGTIVITWTYTPDDPDPDSLWAWQLRIDPPLADDKVEALLTEVLRRI